MKFHLALETGQWVGGFECRKAQLPKQLAEVKTLATRWGLAITCTRVDRQGLWSEDTVRTYVIEPEGK